MTEYDEERLPTMTTDDFVCGESRDHDLEVTYEDDELRQYLCTICGAEIEEDL